MATLRLPLTDQIETRDGTQTKDSTMVNCYVDLVEKKPHVQKRFGTTVYKTLTTGIGQALFDLQGTDYALISDSLYNENNVNFPYTKPGVMGLKYQFVNSSDGLKTTFKNDYSAYVFDTTNVTKVASFGGISTVNITNAGSGGIVGTFPLIITDVGGNGVGAAGTYTVGGAIASTNGITWTPRTLPSSSAWKDVIWNGTIFCAIGTNVCATSTDGITWVARTIPAGNWKKIAWNGTKFCAVQNGSVTSITSSDGITWASVTNPLTFVNIVSITTKGTTFCMFNAQQLDVMQSALSTDNGATWTLYTAYNNGGANCPLNLFSLSSNGTNYVAFVDFCNGTYGYITSADGITWTQRALPSIGIYNSVAWNGTKYCAAKAGTSTVMTSADGLTWTVGTSPLPLAANWSSMSWNGTVFCAVAADAGTTTTSTDGITWIGNPIYSAITWSGITSNGTIFVTVANNTNIAETAVNGTGSFGTVISTQITSQGYGYDVITPTIIPTTTLTTPSSTSTIVGATFTPNVSGYPAITVPGIVFLDGTYYVMTPDNKIYGSAINDPLTWLPLNVITANSISGTGVCLSRYLNYIIAFKSNSMEVFYDSASPPPGSPLSIVPNAISKIGCANAYTVVNSGDSIFYMSYSQKNGYKISTLDNLSSIHISTPSIERIINQTGSLTGNVYSYELKVSGHKFYVLTLTGINITLAYDIDMKRWSKWTSLTPSLTLNCSVSYSAGIVTVVALDGGGNPTAHGLTTGKIIQMATGAPLGYAGTFPITVIDSTSFSYPITTVITNPLTWFLTYYSYNEGYMPFVTYYGDSDDAFLLHETSGMIYKVDPTLFQDAGIPINLNIRTQLFDGNNSDRKHISKVEIIGDKTASTVYFRYTDDDYQTYCTYRTIDMSSQRSQLKRVGSTRRRAFELSHMGNTNFRAESLEIDVDKGID